MKLTNQQHSLIGLILRSPDVGEGWRKVSPVLWPHVSAVLPSELVELRETDLHLRLTEAGKVVAQYV